MIHGELISFCDRFLSRMRCEMYVNFLFEIDISKKKLLL